MVGFPRVGRGCLDAGAGIGFIINNGMDMKSFFKVFWPWLMVPVFWLVVGLLLFAMCGCAGSKHLETERTADYTGHSSSFEDTVDSLRMELSRVVRQTMERFSDLKVENRTVVWSEPDSCGRQYKERESHTSIDRRDREITELEEKTMADYLKLSHQIDLLTEKVEGLSLEKVAERKLSWWEETKLHYGGFALLAVVVCILIGFGRFVYRLKK